ncbi:hypothetical protein GP486_006889 [Trichoglossum hirsutum]|uniref:DUF3020 domain-containing protein n=1 Tax=Trichoglossum hirsutum TaxID=265104 RepID=A0A9P8L758_9PEZI|nr:hypothetical protein GP486_006889 [Trichoglossum hirsutum]
MSLLVLEEREGFADPAIASFRVAFLTAATEAGVAASEESPVVGARPEDAADHANADVLAGDRTEAVRHDMGNSNSQIPVPPHEAEDPRRLSADHYFQSGTDRMRNEGGDTNNLATETARAAISVMASTADRGGAVGGSDSMSIAPKDTNQNDNSGTQDSQAQQPKPAIDIDLSTAPSDPVDLALWVAKQISHFGEHQRLSTGEGLEEDLPGSQGRQDSGHLYNRRQHEDDDNPEKAADRERVRVENRERKKRWRESNADRNKDNDLRCRINKRAKKLYGMEQSPAKSAWMEAEFNKRRAKREAKERSRSFDGNNFAFAPGLGKNLFPTSGDGPQRQTNLAGILLANALLGLGTNGKGPDLDAAKALKAALESGSVDPNPFIEALQVMAAHPDIMNGINAILKGGYDDYEDGGDLGSGDEDVGGIIETTEKETVEDQDPQVDDGDQNEIIKALNAATAMLNEMNQPAGGETSADGKAGFTAINCSEKSKGKEKEKESRSSHAANGHALDQTQIDELLALANGGSLATDNEEDDGANNTVEEAQDQEKEQPQGPQPDNDISATLQSIIQQVLGQQSGEVSSPNTLKRPTTGNTDEFKFKRRRQSSSHPDAKNSTALALTSLMKGAGMAINTVIPAAQSQATSELYTRLSHHSRSSTPSGGGINPAHASSFGTTASMNQRVLAKPNHYHRPLYTANTAAPRRLVTPGISKQKREEEEKKARSFGFPPLPGGVPGAHVKKY